MDLNALADFVAVAAHGGFGAASRLTGTPKPTLSRRVAQLERQIDQRLVERGRSGMRLTAEGQALFERSRPLLAALTDMPLGDATPAGVLRISVPTLLAHAGFGRFASSYHARHPAVRLDVVAEDRIVDPVREGYDLVLRADPAEVDGLIGRRLLSERLLLVAAPGIVANPLPFVALFEPQPEVTVHAPLGTRCLRIDTKLCLSTQVMVRDAVLEEVGAGILPAFLVQTEIDGGRLLSLGAVARPPVDIWALYPSGLPAGARLRSLLDHLDEALPRCLRQERG